MKSESKPAQADRKRRASNRRDPQSLTLLAGEKAPVAAPHPFLRGSPVACFLAADMAALLIAVVAGEPLMAEAPVSSAGWGTAYLISVVAILAVRGGYARRARIQVLDETGRAAYAALLAAMAVVSARSLITGDADGAVDTALLALWVGGLLVAARALVAGALVRALRLGQLRRPTLILGAGKIGNLTAGRLIENPGWGLDPVGFLDDDPLETPGERPVVPVLGGPPDFDRIVEDHHIEHLIVGFSMASHQLMLGLVRRCWELGVSVSLVPRLFEIERDRAGMDRLGGLPLVSLDAPPDGGLARSVKHAIDAVVAAALLLVCAPVIAGIALLVKLVDGGPVLYRQHRVGRDGRHFVMLKFRTMNGEPESDGEADADWAERAASGQELGPHPVTDPPPVDRTTPLGRVLRRLSLDELPQLWNVLVGEMSLIGPRPERVQYAQRFEDAIYRYGDRHRVRSGITGWAQVHGLRGETSLSERVELDNYYIENWSLLLDLKIVLMTFGVLLRDTISGSHMERAVTPSSSQPVGEQATTSGP